MPLRPSLFEQLVFLHATAGPAPLLDMLGGLAFQALAAGVELGLFAELARAPGTLQELAVRLEVSERGLGFLLRALEPLGHVQEQAGTWHNTAQSARWLAPSADTSLSDLIPFFRDLVAQCDTLADSVRGGQHGCRVMDWMAARPGAHARYHRGMRAISTLLAPEIGARVKLPPGAHRLLDLGGSHGLHAVRFCARYPELHGTVLDRPEARAIAEETIAASGLEARVTFTEGDMLSDDLGQGWDVVLLFHVVRILTVEQLAPLLTRVVAALAPGGLVVVLDQLVERIPSALTRANARLVELALMNGSPGEVHRAEDLTVHLTALGMEPPRCRLLARAGGQALLTARKPG